MSTSVTRHFLLLCVLMSLGPQLGHAKPLNVLFVGNSFTYGPPPYDRADQLQLNNLPRIFKLVATSLGHEVNIGEDTIGGCTLYMHRPSATPEQYDATVAAANGFAVADNPRVNASDMCTFSAEIGPLSDTYHECPQLLTRQPYGPWDAISLQDMSALPTVQAARQKMLRPSVEEFAAVLKRQGSLTRSCVPVVASYMTWAYYNASMSSCPGGDKAGCFPLGSLDELTSNCSDTYHNKVRDIGCQGYALARGSAETLEYGTDVLVPAGLAWQMARGSPAIPAYCKTAIDAEYDVKGALHSLNLPLYPTNHSDARWATMEAATELYRDLGPTYQSPYCDNNCHVDHHPSILGMYLNALVFFATLFKKSPIGAAWPDGAVSVDGMVLPAIASAEDAKALQRIAHDAVMPHLNVWWNKDSNHQMCI